MCSIVSAILNVVLSYVIGHRLHLLITEALQQLAHAQSADTTNLRPAAHLEQLVHIIVALLPIRPNVGAALAADLL